MPDSADVCFAALLKQRTWVEPFVPRGSNPTMSNLLRISWERKVEAVRASATPEPPGPPGLRNSVPTRLVGSAAGTLNSATRTFAPLGLS